MKFFLATLAIRSLDWEELLSWIENNHWNIIFHNNTIEAIWHLLYPSFDGFPSIFKWNFVTNQGSSVRRFDADTRSWDNCKKPEGKTRREKNSEKKLDMYVTSKPNGAKWEATSLQVFWEMRITLEICQQTLKQPHRISTNLERFVEGLTKDTNSTSQQTEQEEALRS